MRRQSRLRVEPWVDIFPFLLGRAFIEAAQRLPRCTFRTERFPCFFAGTFIEARPRAGTEEPEARRSFPSPFGGAFIEARFSPRTRRPTSLFPFLLGRAFIEVTAFRRSCRGSRQRFPFLLGRAFIEAPVLSRITHRPHYFPSFLEGPSLRVVPP